MQEPIEIKPWWRRPRVRLSVRALMTAVLILGAGLGWAVRGASLQRNAVAAIMQGGGKVWYDWEWSGFQSQPYGWTSQLKSGGMPNWPKWLVNRLGPDYFGDVKRVVIGPRDPDLVMAYVAQLGRLEELSFLAKVPLSDAGLRHLRGLTELKELAMPSSGSRITAAGLVNLRGLTGLRRLLFWEAPALVDDDLAQLKDLTALQHLQLSYSPRNVITGAGLVYLEDMVNMRALFLEGVQMKSADLSHLRGMTRLSQLVLKRSPIDDLSPIRHLTGLRILIISEVPMSDDGLASVAGFKALQTLSLRDTPITNAGLIHLRNLTSLVRLDLNRTHVTDRGLADLMGLTSLQGLTLADTKITGAGLAHLSGLSSLDILVLSGTKVTDLGLSYLAGLRLLKTLDLSKTRVSDAGLKHLAGLSSLINLNVAETPVTDAGLKDLAGLAGLKRLTVSGTTVTGTGVAVLQNALPGLQVIQTGRGH